MSNAFRLARLMALCLTVLHGYVMFAQQSLPGDWVATTDMYGSHLYQALSLRVDGTNISGEFDGQPLTGSLEKNRLYFKSTDTQKTVSEVNGVLQNDGTIVGMISEYEDGNSEATVRHSFQARALPERSPGLPRTIDFAPAVFSNLFSADVPPVLTIWPGDTIRTKTIDSSGKDEHGITRALYGNPQTGPFYVAGAQPGGVLAVHIKRLTLNRDFADSLDAIADRAKTTRLAVQASGLGKRVRWTLDREHGVARPDVAEGHLKNFTVPLRPMLGCVGVAPAFGFPPYSTGEEGRYGGNMDYNGVVEGATVYLPVSQPGALLYIGDAHAAMGDGETTEWGLETSMDVEFEVEVQPKKTIVTPRVESPTHLAALGFGGSIDEATKRATSGMVQWLQQEYKLSPSESALVLGSAAEYVIGELADRDAGVVLRLRRDILSTLTN